MEKRKSKFNEFIKDVLILSNDKYKMVPEECINELEIIINILKETNLHFEKIRNKHDR